MKRFMASFGGLFNTFGALILYWLVFLTFGIKPAIAVTLVFIVAEIIWRMATHRPFPVLWWFSNTMALVFGAVDLYANTPFMLRYEASVSNLITAAFFAAGAVGEEPLILRFAMHSKNGNTIPKDKPEVIQFFRAFTLLWAAYFVARAGAYLWIMNAFPLPKALMLRTVISWGSLGVMALISMKGRRVFALCQRFGWFVAPSKAPLTSSRPNT
nr:septation protein IspZ [uncultured Acetobacter sp.]